MFRKIFTVTEIFGNHVECFRGIFTARGIKKFIKNKEKHARETGRECFHTITKRKCGRFELKFMFIKDNIKTVTTYIIEEQELNKEI